MSAFSTGISQLYVGRHPVPGCYRVRKGANAAAFGGENGWAWKPYREFVPMKTIEREQTPMTWADCNGPDKEEPISFEKAAIRSRRIEVPAMNIPVGSNKCRCSSCDEYFLTVAAFEAHRDIISPSPAYRRSCANPQGSNWPLHRDQKGYWRLPKREYIVKEAA